MSDLKVIGWIDLDKIGKKQPKISYKFCTECGYATFNKDCLCNICATENFYLSLKRELCNR